MPDELDDAFVARLSALAPAVDLARSRALFERERHLPTARRSRVLLPAAAALLVLGATGIWALASSDDDPTGPISTIPPAITDEPATVTTETQATVTTVSSSPEPSTPVVTVASPPASVVPTTLAPATVPPVDVPSGLTNWPPRSTEIVPVEAVPRLLPSIPVANATTVTGIESTADVQGFHDHVQSWYDRDGDGYVVINSNIGQAPGSTALRTPIDTDGWPTTWRDAYVLPSVPEVVLVELVGDGGAVQIAATGLTESQVVELARTLARRPEPAPGWNVPGLPERFVPFGESGGRLEASRHLLWSADDGILVAELLLSSADANLLTTGWWPNEVVVDIIELEGSEAVVLELPGRISIAWPLPEGGHALFGFTGDRAGAEAIVRSLIVVDQATWDDSTVSPDPGRDGCESLFC